MNNIYFYLLLGIFLYIIFTRVLENYIEKQENFDPSLVPVSSIVTLAKVAQKLVNGNGTLTNPGSLQIGASTGAPGNLIVTGSTTLNGILNANGDISISNSNPYISFIKTGQTAIPQIYSDGSTIHVYNGNFQADNKLTVSDLATLNNGATINTGLLTANAGATINTGLLTANAGATLSSATINGALSAGATNLGSTTVSGKLHIGSTDVDASITKLNNQITAIIAALNALSTVDTLIPTGDVSTTTGMIFGALKIAHRTQVTAAISQIA